MPQEARHDPPESTRPIFAAVPVIEPPVEERTYRQLFDRETLADYLRLSTDTIDRLVKARKLRPGRGLASSRRDQRPRA